MYLVDTNIFLEVMLSRGKKEDCKAFLRELWKGTIKGIVTDFTVHSIIVLMDRLRKLDALEVFLKSLSAYKGLYIYPTSLSDELRAIKLSKGRGLDMDDAIQYAVALSIGADAIISFDKDFDGLEIPRKEPSQVVSL